MRVRVQVDECREFGLVTGGAHVEAVQQSQGATLSEHSLPLLEKEARIFRYEFGTAESGNTLHNPINIWGNSINFSSPSKTHYQMSWFSIPNLS